MSVFLISLTAQFEDTSQTNANKTKSRYGRMTTIMGRTTEEVIERLRKTLEGWEALEDMHARLPVAPEKKPRVILRIPCHPLRAR
jgi:hypothetical protein